MKNLSLCLIIVVIVSCSPKNNPASSPFKKLVWSDEFNVDGAPDSSKWTYDFGTGDNGWGNEELQYYTDRKDNIFIDNGLLNIIAKKENYKTNKYTSAKIKSHKKFDFTYGRIEARAKLPFGVGTWPAIWMLGSNVDIVDWPDCGEIDIMEHVGKEQDKIYGTLHYPGRNGANANGGTTMSGHVSDSFHLYVTEWTKSDINFFVDGKKFFSVPNHDTLPFHKDFYLILNVAMGGHFGGPVTPDFKSSTMEVDYIRVYQ